MTAGRGIHRRIAALTLPAIIATITTPLMSLMDTAFTGRMGGAVYLAAIAVGGNMFNLLYWLFSFLRAGTSGMTAQALGADDRERQQVLLARSLMLAGVLSLTMIVLQRPTEMAFFWFMPTDELTTRLAQTYFRILIWGAPAMLGTYSLVGWLIGMQRSRTAMWLAITVNLVNLAVSMLLVVGFGMKIEGVAVGTLVAQWTGFLFGLIAILGGGGVTLHCSLKNLLVGGDMQRFFSVNRDIFLRTVCLIGVTLWFTRMGALQDELTLAVNALLMQFFLFFSYVTDGVAYAGEALVGMAIGARDSALLRRAVRGTMLWSAVAGGLFTLVYLSVGTEVVSLLSDDEGIRRGAMEYLAWVVAIPMLSFASFTWDGIYIGATASRGLFFSMALATALFFLLSGMLYPRMGNHALWLAFVAYLVCRWVAQALMWRSVRRNVIREE